MKKNIESLIGLLNMYCAQFIFRNVNNKKYKKENDKKENDKKENIILIKLDAIGDFLIWLDCAKEYKQIYKNSILTVVCNIAVKDIAEKCGYFDIVIPIDIRKFERNNKHFSTEIKKISDYKYDALIQSSYSRTLHMDIIAKCICANFKLGMQSDESYSNISRYVMTKKTKKLLDNTYDKLIDTGKEQIMELKRNAIFLEKAFGYKYLTDIPKLKKIDELYRRKPKYKYFVVFPGASSKKKMWSIKNFQKVIDYVQAKKEWKCIVCGSCKESYLYEKLKKSVNNSGSLINYCGKTSLLELAELIRGSEMIVSNDTSAVHFAIATRAKGICLMNDENYGRFMPYSCDKAKNKILICHANMKCSNCAYKRITVKCIINRIINGRYLCMEKINHNDVIIKIDEIINN